MATDSQGNRCRLIVFPGEWDEFYRQYLPGDELPARFLFDQHQLLGKETAADRYNHAATGFELRHQWWWHMTGGGCNYDGIERGVFFPAIIAVADVHRYIVIPQS